MSHQLRRVNSEQRKRGGGRGGGRRRGRRKQSSVQALSHNKINENDHIQILLFNFFLPF